MIVFLFGATTVSGQAFVKQYTETYSNINLRTFSRKNNNSNFLNLENTDDFILNIKEDFLIVSFAPVWKLANFLNKLYINKPQKLKGLMGIIACSSSSIYTKKFAANIFDKDLYKKLFNSEKILFNLSKKYKLPVCILEPTLIYGNIESYKDKNINLLLIILRILPFIFLPTNTGERQPINANQLAAIAILKVRSFMKNKDINFEKIPVGGDDIITFEDMLRRINSIYLTKERFAACYIITIPNKLFYLLMAPIILFSPKFYEALLRISSNLSGFQKASDILKTEEKKFPILNNDITN